MKLLKILTLAIIFSLGSPIPSVIAKKTDDKKISRHQKHHKTKKNKKAAHAVLKKIKHEKTKHHKKRHHKKSEATHPERVTATMDMGPIERKFFVR